MSVFRRKNPQPPAVPDQRHTALDRRAFLQRSARAGGLITAGGALLSFDPRATAAAANKFAYDVSRFGRTDPALLKYAPAGQFASPVAQPRRLAIDARNRLYVAGREGIGITEPDGRPLRTLELPTPGGAVTLAPDGSVLAATRDSVEVFDSDYRRVARWKIEGGKPWVTGLAAFAADVFVADSGNRVIWRFDRAGKPAGKIAEKNKEREIPGLIVPSPYLDVKRGADGLLRVNNPGRHRVELYTTDGDLELFWGKPSAAIEGFCGCCNPVGVLPLPDGRCITCEKGLPRVKLHAADGALVGVVAGVESFPENARAGARRGADGTLGGLDAAADSAGNVLVLDLVTAQVRVFKPLS